MLQIEILITPGLEPGMQIVAVGAHGIVRCLVPVHAVVVETIVGSQIETTAKPPDRLFSFLVGAKEPDIGVSGGHVGVERMQYQRYAHRFPVPACKFWSVGRG